MTETIAHKNKTGFEEHYFSLREKEGRIYSDKEVLQLPGISPAHPHYAEWLSRKESAQRLRTYFQKKLSLLKILEVGCGNGWLSHQLAYIPGCDVTGTDLNFAEIQQAARVFSHIPNVRFVYGGLEAKEIKNELYDCIVFASCIQYFPSIADVIGQVQQKLTPAGEIHILDSPFYRQHELAAARKRTEDYYYAAGFPEMTQHYHHHQKETLRNYSYRELYRPSFLNRWLKNNRNPFPWICIKKEA